MSRILVTGACGYIGAILCKYLAQQGNEITALDNHLLENHENWSSLMKEVIIEDIREKSTIDNLVNRSFEVVIHLISLDHKKSEDSPDFISSINVLPTWNLLEKFTKAGLKKFIYFSTFQVYGKVPSKEITENFNPSPQNSYGLTHLLSENICNYYNKKTSINCINVRLSNNYGSPVFRENNCWWLVINDFCKGAFSEKEIILLSDGSPKRDFIHSSDVCRAVEILVNTDKKNLQNNTYHISSGKTLTILELSHTVKSVYKKRYHEDIKVILPDHSISENPDKFSETERYIVNNSKLKSLGFKPETDLKNGINELFDFLENSYSQ